MMEVPRSGAIYVGPTCHVQTADKRFGSHVLDDIKTFVNEGHGVTNEVDLDDDDDDDDDDLEDDDMDDGLEPDGIFDGWQHFTDETAASHPDEDDEHHGFPRLARCRANLTALSQQYNLYFAAYQGQIHVFQPQKAPQILPPPSLILRPPRSRAGKLIGGYIDRNFGHQVNYIVTGELGNLEVLLMCYDDGDVIAYYTHLIAHAVEHGGASQGACHVAPACRIVTPKPFFHENVGLSAWGLAIHRRSRLLAVSCNKHDVTVFAFATKSGDAGQLDSEPEASSSSQDSPKLWSGQTALELERHFRSRTRTWRIVLPLGPAGSNIPSIAFVDDEDGNAERVVAVDIAGNTWMLNIWQIGGFPAVYLPNTNRGADHQRYTGWGIMVLPDSSFKLTSSNRAAMGLPPKDILGPNRSPGDRDKTELWLDITCSLHYIKDNAVDSRVFLRQRYGPRYFLPQLRSQATNVHQQPLPTEGEQDHSEESDFLDESDDSDAPEPYDAYQQISDLDAESRWLALSKAPGPKGSGIDLSEEELRGFRLARTIVPTLGQTPPLFGFSEFLDFMGNNLMRKGLTHTVDWFKTRLPSHLSRNFSLLRTTDSDVELQSLDPRSAGVFCKDVIVPHNRRPNNVLPWDLTQRMSERISMHQHVPALNLVVLGSLCGRVALLSLTKPPSRHHHGGGPAAGTAGVRVRRAFRVECVLPRAGPEDSLRPTAALHGVAVSPVHDHRAGSLALARPGGGGPVRYRLVLHYIDHTILMYDLARSSPEEDLMIF